MGTDVGRCQIDEPLFPFAFACLNLVSLIVIHMLNGQDLIDYVKANELLTQTALARGAGYVRQTRSGKEQVLVKDFYNALLAAKGMEIVVGRAPGKAALYETTVHKSGVILLGKTYSRQLGLRPGQVLDIVIEDDSIQLVPRPVKKAAASRF